MMNSKKWYTSKGVWGSIISLVSLGIGVVKGVQIDTQTQAVIVDQTYAAVTAAGSAIGSLIAIYGRINATKVIEIK